MDDDDNADDGPLGCDDDEDDDSFCHESTTNAAGVFVFGRDGKQAHNCDIQSPSFAARDAAMPWTRTEAQGRQKEAHSAAETNEVKALDARM